MTDRISSAQSSPSTNFYLEADVSSQSIDGNYTTLVCYLRAVNTGNTTSHANDPGSQVGSVDGVGQLGSHSANPFMPSGYGGGATRWRDGPFYINVPHNADGTRSITLRMDLNYTGVHVGLTAAMGLPTIPRASQPSVSPASVDAGAAVTINTNRASSGFTHTLSYTMGSASGTIATGVGASTSWTPPLALLTQIPSALSGVVTITCVTYSGSTPIGTKTVALTLTVPASVVPTIGSVSCSEATSIVATKIGAYVQAASTLNVAAVGAAGVYGSTISTYTITVAGQAIFAQSGVTGPIQASGSVVITATVVDSRGRTAQKTITITVLAYAPPQISAGQFRRALSDGTVTEDGTNVRVDAVTTVSSLKPASTEKNTLTWVLRTKPRSSSTWATQGTWTGLTVPTFSGWKTGDSVLVSESRDCLLTVTDVLGNTRTLQGIISTALGVFHLTTDGRVGAGKYAEPGRSVDAFGPMFQNNGAAVVDEAILAAFLPAGFVLYTAASFSPAGWLLCRGQSLLRSAYPALFNAIGTTYGAVDSSHFSIPNPPGKSVVGLDPSQTEFNTLGKTGGEKTHSLTSAELPSSGALYKEVVLVPTSNIDGGGSSGTGTGNRAYMAAGGAPYTRLWQGGGGAHNNLPPYIVFNFVIKY